MNATLHSKIRDWVKEAWLDQAPEGTKLTLADLRTATSLSMAAAPRVTAMRHQMGITWQQAWSEIAPEVLGTPRPSAAKV